MAKLKKVMVPDTARKTAFVAAEYAVGQWCYPNGVFSEADIAALGAANSNKPGFASVGDAKLTRAGVGTPSNAAGRCFPIDKLIFIPEDSDSDHTTIEAGASVVYYTAGQFETDQYSDVSGTGGAFGDYLKIGANGVLVEETTPTTETALSVARVIKVNDSGPDVNFKSLVFEMIND